MAWALLGALILLSSRGEASISTGGEWCRRWTYEQDSPVATFQCPQLHDGADAQFCCGSCSLPFCCASGEARLEQQQCPGVGRQEATTGGPRTTQPATTKPHLKWRAGSGFLLFIFLAVGTALWVFTCYYKERCCRPPYENFFNPDESMGLDRLRTLRHRSPHSIIGDPTRSVAHGLSQYGGVDSGSIMDLPACSPTAHIQSATAGPPKKKVCMACSPVHRNIPGHALEPVTEIESSVDR